MSHLFTPLTLRELVVPNRAWVSPMCMYACEDPARPGQVGAWHVAHYGQFALGGAGLILTEATAVLPEGRVTPQDAGLWTDDQIAPWRTVTDAVHALDGLIGVQLAHAGRKAGHYRNLPGDDDPVGSVPAEDGGWTTVGAGDRPFGEYAPPRAATDADLRAVVGAFAAAAARAVSAGFDAVELHGAHGYLLHELLSPVTNDRADRRSLLVDVVRAVRAELPAGMPLLVRLSVSDVAPGGLEADDSAALAPLLLSAGADLIDCSSGGLVPGAEYRPAPGYQVPGCATVRAAGSPTAAVGLITEPAHAEDVLASGAADAVLLGRAMLRDPHWARHAAVALGDGSGPRVSRYHRAWRRTVLAD